MTIPYDSEYYEAEAAPLNGAAPLDNPFKDDAQQEMLAPPAPPELPGLPELPELPGLPVPPTEARGRRPSKTSHRRSTAFNPRPAGPRARPTAASRSVIKRASHSELNVPTPAMVRPQSDATGLRAGIDVDAARRRPRPMSAHKTTTLRRDIGGKLDLPAPRVESPVARQADVPVNPLRGNIR